MRKYIPTLLAVLLAALTSVNATAAGNYYLFVSDANGQTAQSIEMPKCITFTDTHMLLHLQNGTKKELALDGVSKLWLADASTAITEVKNEHPINMHITDGQLVVNTPTATSITLLDINGKVMMSVACAPGEQQFCVAHLPKGIYLIKNEPSAGTANQQVRKMIKK